VKRYWPLGPGRIVTSPFGPRAGGFHYGTDFGFPGGSGGRMLYAIQSGTIIYAGAAQGYGGGDPAGLAGWLVIDSSTDEGGGVLEYGHIVRAANLKVGSTVVAGQAIGIINPDQGSNGGVAPHLHLSDMPAEYSPAAKQDPMLRLRGALDPPAVEGKPPVASNRPDFNEYPLWSPNNEARGGVKPDLFLLHTEEGGPVKGGADRLARWLGNPANQVSYHYTISQDPDDNGVTVVDVVDTDRASWSALTANRRSINLVFAGSRAAWSRTEWLRNSRAIDVAAYLAAQDCAKYPTIPKRVIKPPYGPPGGISDHRYVTRYLNIGSHTDVGDGFPWDVFEAAFLRHAGVTPPIVVPPPPPPPPPTVLTDRQLLEAINTKLDRLLAQP
jgi:hypothetical protein